MLIRTMYMNEQSMYAFDVHGTVHR